MDRASWIPLRVDEKEERGELFRQGYESDLHVVVSAAIPTAKRDQAAELGWSHFSRRDHRGYVDTDGLYVPADVDQSLKGSVPLVLVQPGSRDDPTRWLLHQDLSLALDLRREGDKWVSLKEGYATAARYFEIDGRPSRIEIKANYLKDYLCARGMALYVTSFRDRIEVVTTADHIGWPDNVVRGQANGDRWIYSTEEIHEGGGSFGAEMAVVWIGREGLDRDEDVPAIGPTDEGVVSASYTLADTRPKVVRVRGERWRDEWVEPALTSPRVRKDNPPSTATFFIDAQGQRVNADDLLDEGRWLWFEPSVVARLAHARGGQLSWSTRDTGRVGRVGYTVVFGLNRIGLVTVYAKDIAQQLPEWIRVIWSGYSVVPEGGVGTELFQVQAEGRKVDTAAPESLFHQAMVEADEAVQTAYDCPLFRPHPDRDEILFKTHRFRATDHDGLRSLAKDVARLTADRMDVGALREALAVPKDARIGSLKLLETAVARRIGESAAREITGPLHGAYSLRLDDAHLPRSDQREAYRLLGVNPESPPVIQGRRLLEACAISIGECAESILKVETTAP